MALAENWQAGALAQIGSLTVENEQLRAALQQCEQARVAAVDELEALKSKKRKG